MPTVSDRMRLLPIALLLCTALPAHASACWEEAGRESNVSPALLYAVAKVESSLNPAARNTSHIARTGSYGIGLMQIESSHLPRLKRRGIDEAKLLSDSCTNIKEGAAILAEQFRRLGVTWEAVGAYNASCTVLKGDDCRRARSTYAWKVYRSLHGAEPRSAKAARHPLSRTGAASPAPAKPSDSQPILIQGRLS